jgi:hypothetical protein
MNAFLNAESLFGEINLHKYVNLTSKINFLRYF